RPWGSARGRAWRREVASDPPEDSAVQAAGVRAFEPGHGGLTITPGGLRASWREPRVAGRAVSSVCRRVPMRGAIRVFSDKSRARMKWRYASLPWWQLAGQL